MAGKLDELSEIARERADEAIAPVIQTARDVADGVADAAGAVVGAGGKRLRKFVASRPKLERTFQGVQSCAEHLSGAFRLFGSQFSTDLEVQIPQDPGRPYGVLQNRADACPVSVITTAELQRVVFHGAGLFIAGSSSVTLETSDGARIEVTCGPLHEVGFKIRRPDGTTASASAAVGVDEWLSATGPLDEGIQAVRLRHHDFEAFQPAKCTDRGPGRFRALMRVSLK